MLITAILGSAAVAGSAFGLYKKYHKPADAAAAEPNIVAAVASMAAVRNDKTVASRIEKAMSDAVTYSLNHGVSIEDSGDNQESHARSA
jgi:hypothetical protein